MKIYQEQDIIQIEQLRSQVKKYLNMLSEVSAKADKNRLLCETNSLKIKQLEQ